MEQPTLSDEESAKIAPVVSSRGGRWRTGVRGTGSDVENSGRAFLPEDHTSEELMETLLFQMTDHTRLPEI